MTIGKLFHSEPTLSEKMPHEPAMRLDRKLPSNVILKAGRFYYRYRMRNNQRLTIRLPDISSPNFAAEYERARVGAQIIRSSAMNLKPIKTDLERGSFSHLISIYRRSELGAHADNTQRSYERYLAIFEMSFGHKLVASLKAPAVIKMRDSMTETPGKARNFLTVLKVLLNYAIVLGMIEVNPCDKVKKPRCEEHKPWPQHVIDQALQAASPMLRLAIQTALYSGQRIGDIIRITHDHMLKDPVVIGQQKLRSHGERVVDAVIPVHPGWLDAIAQVEPRAKTLLYDRNDRSFENTEPMQSQMRRLMEQLGYCSPAGYGVQYTFHGLRKNAANYLAEIGCSTHQIGSICGMSLETVIHYTRGVAKRKLAESSREMILGSSPERRKARSLAA